MGRYAHIAVVLGVGLVTTWAVQRAEGQTYSYSTVYNFTGGADGYQIGNIQAGPEGNIYAVSTATYVSNPSMGGNGAIVEMSPITHAVNIIDSFPSGAGLRAIPEAPFYFDKQGNLYGLSVYGGPANAGTFFEIPAGSHSATVLTSFTGSNGDNPAAPGLVADASGNIYATTFFGGIGYTGTINTGNGTLFKIGAGTNTITDIVKFTGANGQNPAGNLFMDSSGDIFGVTSAGGMGNDGTLYELPAGSTTIKTLYNFTSANADPSGGVIADSQGNLYGVTGAGGPGGYGTIYKFNLTTQALTTLFNFNGSNGNEPGGDLYLSTSGDLIGGSVYGGTYGLGDVFDFNPQTSGLKILHSFGDGNTDGIFPSTVVADSRGDLFGVGGHGGLYGDGTIFELAVPEPCATAVLTLAGAYFLARRRRRRG